MPHKGQHDDDAFIAMAADPYGLYQTEGVEEHGHSSKEKEEMSQDQKNYEASKKKLYLVSFVTVFFIIAQCIGGYLSGSIAIITDTAHLSTDMIGFAISIFCLKLGQRDASKELTYGWHRAEIIGTLVSIMFLVTVTMYLLKEAIARAIHLPEIESEIMLITAVAGLFFNLIQMSILHQGEGHYHLGGDDDDGEEGHGHSHEGGGHDHGHSHSSGPAEANINVSAAYCHALSDMIMSIGVIIAATIIYFKPSWRIADPICTFVFSIIVCVTVVPITMKCLHILMEGAPAKGKVDIEKLIKEIKKSDPEMEISRLHVWSITQSKVAMSCHIKTTKNTGLVLKEVNKLAKDKYKLHHVTVQIEDANSPEHQLQKEDSPKYLKDMLQESSGHAH